MTMGVASERAIGTEREREDKFDIAPGARLPRSRPGHKQQVHERTVELESTYFDTPDHRLLHSGVTLRRRRGDTDRGWQLKVPAGSAREEIRVDDDHPAEFIPDELARLLPGLSGGQPLRRVAEIRTVRRVQQLVRADGTVLAELADDRVHAAAGGPTGLLSEWREAEIELGPAGDERLLARLGARLRAAGAQPSAYESKLARALDIAPPPPAGRSTRALLTYLSEQHRMIVAGDLALRLAPTNPETVHDTRVAARRFRSTLRVFASWFDPVEARHLAEELRWYAGVLGEIRDRDVQQRRLLEELSGLPPELALGPVRARITEQLAGESAHHREILRTELDGGRYAALLARLAEWHAAPPLSGAGRPVPKEAARAERKLLRRLRTAVEHQDDAQMHRARKAGKRARYAAELAAAAGHRGQNQPVVKRMRRLQDALGEFQDSVTSRATLRRLGAAAGTTKGENGFTFGLLHEREAGRGALARADAAAWLSRNG